MANTSVDFNFTQTIFTDYFGQYFEDIGIDPKNKCKLQSAEEIKQLLKPPVTEKPVSPKV